MTSKPVQWLHVAEPGDLIPDAELPPGWKRNMYGELKGPRGARLELTDRETPFYYYPPSGAASKFATEREAMAFAVGDLA